MIVLSRLFSLALPPADSVSKIPSKLLLPELTDKDGQTKTDRQTDRRDDMREKRETAEVFSLMKSFELKQVMHFQGWEKEVN